MPKKALAVVYRLCFAALIPIVSFIHFSLNTYRDGVREIKTILDEMIPLVSFFAVPYLYWFAYIFLALVFFAFVDGRYYFKLLMSIVVGMLTCFVFFIFFPTTVPRPEILTDDILSRMVKYIYSLDNPYNCFPSIHVLDAILVSAFLLSFAKKVLWDSSRLYANILILISVVSGVSISLSTVFVKQHYVLDIAAGLLLAVFYFRVFNNDSLWRIDAVKKGIYRIIPAELRKGLDMDSII